jgi:hypothetical protein
MIQRDHSDIQLKQVDTMYFYSHALSIPISFRPCPSLQTPNT